MTEIRKRPKHNCDSKWIFCCKSGEQLPTSMRCNGQPECPDGSDEAGCNITCAAPQFRCNDGACLQETEVCDGIEHCANGADEHNCRNQCWKKDLFECRAEGTCIPPAVVCDGRKDCSDGSDEDAKICADKPRLPVNACEYDQFLDSLNYQRCPMASASMCILEVLRSHDLRWTKASTIDNVFHPHSLYL